MDEDNNIFEKDDVLDYVIYEDIEKQDNRQSNKSGCFGILLLFMLPFIGVSHFLYLH
jgi:hypothetical protein